MNKVLKLKRTIVSKLKLQRMFNKEDSHAGKDNVLSLKDEQQCSDFFEDICTITELKAMAQRLEVARLLDEGEIYEEIVEKTGASTATISRVKRCLVYGADGYNSVMPVLREGSKGK